jgi:hypothetical protein
MKLLVQTGIAANGTMKLSCIDQDVLSTALGSVLDLIEELLSEMIG